MGRAARSRRRALAACKDTRELKQQNKNIEVAARSAQVGESSQIAPDSSPSAVVESYTAAPTKNIAAECSHKPALS